MTVCGPLETADTSRVKRHTGVRAGMASRLAEMHVCGSGTHAHDRRCPSTAVRFGPPPGTCGGFALFMHCSRLLTDSVGVVTLNRLEIRLTLAGHVPRPGAGPGGWGVLDGHSRLCYAFPVAPVAAFCLPTKGGNGRCVRRKAMSMNLRVLYTACSGRSSRACALQDGKLSHEIRTTGAV